MARTIRQYEIVGKLGSGGMGVVYKARDTTLGRFVALKFLPAHADVEADRTLHDRLIQEARAASALDHPNIGIVHEVGHTEDGQAFIALACYDGDTLKALLDSASIPLPRAISIVRQIALGLAAAHAHGIIHRDIKPANVIVTTDDVVKIIDFGIAKLGDTTHLTDPGSVVGTPAYMSPEQARGDEVDARTDLWSLVVVSYELLTGHPPFRGGHGSAVIHGILHDMPPRIRSLKPELPPALERLVAKGLEKAPGRRYQSATEFLHDLDQAVPVHRPDLRRRGRLVPALAVVAILIAAIVTVATVRQSARQRWARETALPEVQALAGRGDNVSAVALATEAERHLPDDPVLRGVWPEIAGLLSVTSTPPGAEVFMRPYGSQTEPWTRLGATPLSGIRVPRAMFQWRVEKAGFPSLEFGRAVSSRTEATELAVTLDAVHDLPPGMVRVPGGMSLAALAGLENLPPQRLHDFWIDTVEVTNRAFKAFMDAGGYSRPEFWQEPMSFEGRVLTLESALPRFRDATGRLGPSTWELGMYPAGQDDFPVAGVSWYEAAAFARYAGKALPSVYHWSRAAGTASSASSFVVAASNIDARGSRAAVAAKEGLGPFGTWHMAGNVKEWAFNQGRGDTRYILGGAWNEPAYMFVDKDAQSPWARTATLGFRCVKYPNESPTGAVTGQLLDAFRDYAAERPVPEATHAGFQRMFSYDRRDLRASVDGTDTSHADWRRETVRFDAGYGAERVTAYIYVPSKGATPFQAIVYAPGSDAFQERDFERYAVSQFDFMIKSGRIVVVPVFKGTFDRRSELETDSPAETAVYRDHVVAWVRDLNRTLDYLATRTDISHERIGYFGLSWGGALPQLLANEPRLKANVLVAGAYYFTRAFPEVDQINYVPRVTTPTLLINGDTDFYCPVETCARPFYRLLGTPERLKRLVLTQSGHFPPRNDLVRETLDWFDRHLGPVQ